MLIVYKQLENDVVDFSHSITVDSIENIPDGYVQIDTEQTNNPEANVRYKDDGTPMTQEELEAIVNAPVPKMEIEILKEENERLKVSIYEMTTYAASQDEKITRQNQAILELTTLITGGNA